MFNPGNAVCEAWFSFSFTRLSVSAALACLLACAPPGSVSVSAGLQPNVLIRSHVIHMQMSHYLGITSTTDVTSASSSSVSQLSKSASVIRQASCLVSSNINLAQFSSFNTYSWLPNKRVATCRSILANFALYMGLLGCYT